ncbi:MAG: PAC2 family protein, partial [Dehalococcoidia bacterium]|nr:PAC2 family protein [Dehalococcoidia bacterium]
MHEPVPDLKEPHGFILIRPWVVVGRVATITLARLEQHFGAKELGILARPGNFFDFTRYRPTLYHVVGYRRLKAPNSAINYAQPDGGPDLVFFQMLEPHPLGEDYAE